MTNFAKLLKHSENAANNDQANFKKWANGQVSLAWVILAFRKNNSVPEDVEIDLEEFKEYLGTLGYWKNEG